MSYELIEPPAVQYVGARIEFTTEQIAELLRITNGHGLLKGAWAPLRDAGDELGLNTLGEPRV